LGCGEILLQATKHGALTPVIGPEGRQTGGGGLVSSRLRVAAAALAVERLQNAVSPPLPFAGFPIASPPTITPLLALIRRSDSDVLIKLLDFNSIEEGGPPDQWRPPDVVLDNPQDFDAYTSGYDTPQ
jgi:hypothetical protein